MSPLTDQDLVNFDNLPESEKNAPPLSNRDLGIFINQQRQEEAYGYSAFVMIAESHISIHTFPELKYASFDCYSCKGFDETKVVEILKKFFDIVKQMLHIDL